MLHIKKINFIPKNKKKLNFILYLFSFFILFSLIYFSIPKLLNFSQQSIKENLKSNNNISINKISKISYKIFPTPRLYIPSSNFVIGDRILEVNNGEINIILNINQIFNFRKINYKKLIIKKGSLKINFNNIKQLINITNKSKKKLIFTESSLIFLNKGGKFFEITNALIKINQAKNKKEISVDGNFLNNKIFIRLDKKLNNKNNLIFEIPDLDISTQVFFKTNNSGDISGLFNFEIFNNFLKFNFTKENSIKIKNGFIRSKLLKSSVDGELFFRPNFFTKLDFKLSSLDIEKLFLLMQKNYFYEDINDFTLIKKINGFFNFQSKFEGIIISENGEILFKDFKLGKDKSLYFNGKITEVGKKGKIQFNLIKIIDYKKNQIKQIEIFGYLIPFSDKVIFSKIILDGKKLSLEKTKNYQKKFKKEVVQESLKNIFSESKINKFFKDLI